MIVFNVSTVTASIFIDNYDPFLIIVNERKGTLIEQLYNFDNIINGGLSQIEIPVLSVYGKYDVTTGFQQGAYLLNNVSTLETDKQLIILNQSGHSFMKNEPVLLANEIQNWIEKYK